MMHKDDIHINRLIHENSPYLLQHARNPVDWYPWGDEAFAKAKEEDKPVFLSIGYSACHWCHVMEKESFEDEGTARILNERFVSIKVDREERPDIDHVYMEACVRLTGQGGWPLSCFLTPDKIPFFTGTYFPKEDRYHIPGFKRILQSIAELWASDRPKLLHTSENIFRHVTQKAAKNKAQISGSAAHAAYMQLQSAFDSRNGGFGHAPKFPSVHNLLFLLRYGILEKADTAFEMVEKTLACMRKGGIFDHVGGGFCRYSTDPYWLVPHFEKMMYDNAMLAIAYCEAGAVITPAFIETAQRILQYCMKEMRDPEGGFYTAEDADSEGVEGKYYVFSPEEVIAVLGEQDGKRFCTLFDVTKKGNFEGKNILNLIGKELSQEEKDFASLCLPGLYDYRNKRVHPFKDDKILASVNGLMIAALSIAGKIVHRDDYTGAAADCAHFILNNLVTGGRLHASYRQGVSAHPATLEDYAYIAWGLLELYQASFAPEWLEKALHIADDMISLFEDEGSAFFISGKDVSDLPVRTKNLHDGALPSGNSVAANIFLRLSEITGNEDYAKKAEGILNAVAQDIKKYPTGYTAALCAQLLRQSGMRKITVVNGEGLEQLKDAVNIYDPFANTVIGGPGYDAITRLAPYIKDYQAKEGKAAVFICDSQGCRPPLYDAEQVADALEKS